MKNRRPFGTVGLLPHTRPASAREIRAIQDAVAKARAVKPIPVVTEYSKWRAYLSAIDLSPIKRWS